MISTFTGGQSPLTHEYQSIEPNSSLINSSLTKPFLAINHHDENIFTGPLKEFGGKSVRVELNSRTLFARDCKRGLVLATCPQGMTLLLFNQRKFFIAMSDIHLVKETRQ